MSTAMVERVVIGDCTLYCGDCMAVLPTLPKVGVCITDPPYGINADAKQANRAGRQHGRAAAESREYGHTSWDDAPPPPQVFAQIQQISGQQVVFGGNYFTRYLPPSPSWIVWDKDNGTNGYADFELAWTSHDRAARKVRWRWHGMLQERGGDSKEDRVHPTQKPLGLMLWVIDNYSSEGDVLLDPFMGSGTTGVACVQLGRKFVGIEKHRPYFDIACRRIHEAYEVRALFEPVPKPIHDTVDLFEEVAHVQ